MSKEVADSLCLFLACGSAVECLLSIHSMLICDYGWD